MNQAIKLILKPRMKDGVLISDESGDAYVIFEGMPTQEEIEFVNKNDVKNLILIDLYDFSILTCLPQINKLRIICSYAGRKEKHLKVDFSAVYKLRLHSLDLTISPKVLLSERYDCSKQAGLKKLKACFEHIVNLHKIESLESLLVNLHGKLTVLDFLTNKKELKYLNLHNGKFINLNGLSECTSLISLTLKDCEIKTSSEIGALSNLKNLFVASMVYDDIGKSLDKLTMLEYLYLNYNGTLDTVCWLKKMKDLKVFVLYCKVVDGNLEVCDQIPYVKIAIEYAHYNRKNIDLSKKVLGLSISGIPTYVSF